MGTLRDYSCYTAPCKTFADGDQDNFIRWYFVPDERPFYEGTHVFPPRVDDCYEATGHEYERTGLSPNPRVHYSGRDYWHKEGTAVDADDDDLMGRSLSAKYEVNGYPPPIPCIEPEHVFAEIGLSARKFTPPIPVEFAICGLKLSGFGYPDPNDPILSGLKLGVIEYELSPAVEDTLAGLAVGAITYELSPAVENNLAGLAVGAVEDELTPAVEDKLAGLAVGAVEDELAPIEDKLAGLAVGAVEDELAVIVIEDKLAGLAVGVVADDLTPAVESSNAGVKLGEVKYELAPDVESSNAGVKLGDVKYEMTPAVQSSNAGVKLGEVKYELAPAVESSNAGVKLGSVNTDIAPPVSPGSTCATAPTIVMGTPYTFNISAGQSHWFFFPVSAGQQYYVKCVKNSGSTVNAHARTGPNCSTPTVEFNLFVPPNCNTFTKGSATNGWALVDSVLTGTANYTLTVGLGACPP